MKRVFVGKTYVGSLEVIQAYLREYRGSYVFKIVPLDNGDYRLDAYKEEFSLFERFLKGLFD